MTYPPPTNDPWSAPPPSPPVDPTLPASGPPVPTQPAGPDSPVPAESHVPVESHLSADPYAPVDPYAGAKVDGPPPPVGYPTSGYPAPGYPAPGHPAPGYAPYPGYAPPPKTNGLAIAALVLSLVGFTSCITGPVGAIMGHVAMRQIRETGEGGEGLAKAAIIVGWIVTALLVVFILFYVGIFLFAISSSSTSSY
ncbi:protein of unknown function [Micromonospora nigra]|uniref:DUF4190 domain-containing protein n=1 Tax=Micromonospora nigra TaxID=145857 RepID=A0A1C6SBF4_9ACTN|nr:DUF4190 domain-containing protein [Micromonospora nigra]SCL26804.1 protein of unknown function [Micromonospora nigra]